MTSKKIDLSELNFEKSIDFESELIAELNSKKISKSKSTKTAINKKVKSETSRKSKDKNKEESVKKSSKLRGKKDTKLVDKKCDQLDADKKEEKIEIEKKLVKSSKVGSEGDGVISSKSKKSAEADKTEKTVKESKKTEKIENKLEKAEKELEKAKKAVEESKSLNTIGTDLLISFDTTGSMYSVLSQVRRNINKLVKDMMGSVENLNIGVIAHGDYCDANDPYTIRVLDFTNNLDKIIDFVTNTRATDGGDSDECYELVLNTAHKVLSWRNNVNKVMLLIGDANPHRIDYAMNKDGLDWKEEAKKLAENNIKVLSVHALSYYREWSKSFYETVASITNGTYLTLDQFNDVNNLILATCYAQSGIEKLTEFVEVIRNGHEMTNNLARNVNRLAGKQIVEEAFSDLYFSSRVYGYDKTKKRSKTSSSDRYKTDYTEVQKDGLIPVVPGRFQTMTVDENCAIKQFVLDNGLKFKIGRGFYELSKAEDVQQYKEVLLQNKETGLMYNGAQVREYLKLKPQITKGGVTERLYFDKNREYRVFVQSTSVNRKLIGGTEFLYEVEDI